MSSYDAVIERVVAHNRKVVLLNLLSLAILLWITFDYRDLLRNGLLGPYPIAPDALEQKDLLDARGQYFLRTTFPSISDTGIVVQESYDFSTVTLHIYLARLPRKTLILESPLPLTSLQGKDIELQLGRIPGDVHSAVVTALANNSPLSRASGELITEYMATPSSYRLEAYEDAAVLGFSILFSLYYLYLGIARRDITRHPAIKKLAAFGRPEILCASLNQELLLREELVELKNYRVMVRITLTRSWLLVESGMMFEMIPLDDIVWIYKQVLIFRYKTCDLKVFRKSTQKLFQFCVSGHREEPIDTLVTLIAKRRPWVLVGYDPQLLKKWNTAPQEIIADYEKRRLADNPFGSSCDRD